MSKSYVRVGAAIGHLCAYFWWLCVAAPLVHAAIEQRETKDRVLLVHEQRQDLLISELVTRVRGELVAAGFTVDVATDTAIADPRRQVEALARTDVVATFVILRDLAKDALEVWLHDRLTNKTTVRSIRVSGADSRDHRPGVLAVRVVEVLRASLLELISRTSTPTRDTPQPTPAVSQWVATAASARPLEPPGYAVSVAMGLGVLQSLDRVPASLLPSLAVQAMVAPAWSVRLVAAGFGTRPEVDSPAGAARLQQGLALAEVNWCLSLSTRGCLDLSGGAGVFHLRVQGEAMSPYQARAPSAWSGAMTAGAGVSWGLPGRWNVGAHTHAVVLWPQPMVRIAGVEVGRVGRPSLLSEVYVAVGF